MADNIFQRIASFIMRCCNPETDNANEIVFSLQTKREYDNGAIYKGEW